MLAPFAMILLMICGGSAATYWYEQDAPLSARLCAGACTGFAAFGLIGFLCASFTGLTPLALLLTSIAVASPLALLWKPEHKNRIQSDIASALREARRTFLHPTRQAIVSCSFYVLTAFLLWRVFDSAMFERADGIYTGFEKSLGDLPFHLSIVTSFAHGQNFPPEHTEFAGSRFSYPFLVDFIAACLVRAGASLRDALFWENFTLGLALIGLLHRWAWKLVRDQAAAFLTVTLVLFSGGLGWWLLLHDASVNGRGLFDVLTHLPQNYTSVSGGIFQWSNALTALLVPQRGFLLGLPLVLLVWTLWWQAINGETEVRASVAPDQQQQRKEKRKEKRVRAQALVAATEEHAPDFSLGSQAMRRMIAAGAVAGMLPLTHAHGFMVVMFVGFCLALLFRERWREWIAFFAIAFCVAAPQALLATQKSVAHSETFFAWNFGWEKGEHNIFWFWLVNTGAFIPLLVLSLWQRAKEGLASRRLLLFYLPFMLCFIIPNLVKLAPWSWDNIKVLFYWYVASAPLVAAMLVWLWRRGAAWRVATIALCVSLMLAGALDVWRALGGTAEQKIFDADGIAFAELIKRETSPRAVILIAPTYNHPIFLTGRRALMGYAGHLWSHGIDYAPREADVRRIYVGAPDADALLSSYAVEYAVVGPLERAALPVNEAFFERYPKVGETVGYRLYKIARPQK